MLGDTTTFVEPEEDPNLGLIEATRNNIKFKS